MTNYFKLVYAVYIRILKRIFVIIFRLSWAIIRQTHIVCYIVFIFHQTLGIRKSQPQLKRRVVGLDINHHNAGIRVDWAIGSYH